MRKKTRRGQTLLLGALFLFLTALMVLVTLSVGQRTRERIEAQLAADAAAYSNAVVTARTLNEIALINRTHASMMVAMLGVQSLISWSGHHRSHLKATGEMLKQAEAPYVPCCGNPFCAMSACSCAELARLRGAQSAVAAEQARVATQWDELDTAAANYASDLWAATVSLNESTRTALARLDDRLKGQALAGIIAQTASPELTAPAKGDRKSLEETQDSKGCEGAPGLYCSSNELETNRIVSMGSRGWHFVTARTGADALIRSRLEETVRPFNPLAGISPAVAIGGAGAGRDKEAAQQLRGHPGEHFYGEDHAGDLRLDWPAPGCMGSSGASSIKAAWVKSNHTDMSGDEHKYADSSEPARRHNLALRAGDRSSYPWSFEYNYKQLASAKNDFGQPKLYAIVERDFAQRKTPWPWDLTFRFRMSPHGEGAKFDLGRTEGGFKSPSGADLQHQVAISSAIAYYHRPALAGRGDNFWAEPPNLWNPFWRATLYAPDDDLAKYVDKAGFPEHADTLRRLLKAGMAGTR